MGGCGDVGVLWDMKVGVDVALNVLIQSSPQK